MFLHFFLLVVSIFFLTSRGENSTSLCSTTYDCGNDVVIKYPFWVNSTNTSSQLCGYPKFGLTCSNKEALFSMPGDTYYVKAINYDNYTIKLVDADLGSLTCPRARHNVTIDTLPLKFSNLSLNLSFYFNCSSSPFTTNVPRIGCLGLGTRQSYVIDLEQDEETGWSEICEDHVVANVMRSEISNDLVSGFGAAMNEGFVLEWDVPRECAACEIVDGGRCGFDQREEMFLCFCEDGRISRGKNGSRCRGHNSAKLKVIIGVSAGVGGALLVCLVGQIVYRRRKKSIFAPMSWMSRSTTTSYASSKSKFDIEEKGGEFKGVHLFSYDELEEATDHFAPDNELGNGGFGTVYKGKLRDKRIVAVKRLFENNYKRVEQFLNEVVILTDLRHPNLVSLYGCTSRHSRELLLVYEYISNGTVADHLHGNRQKNGGLPWPTRMKIAVETATALSYLHTSEIIHRDVKTNNILLDSNFVVKVADFGLSRLFPTDVTHVSTAPQGTPGYVDPEYHECYQLTVKSDVYSFGVVLVELISSLPAVDITRHRQEINLSNMAINKIQNDALHELVDKNLGYESDYEVRKMINSVAELAFQCLQSAKEMRPSMGDVLENLKQIQGHEDNTEKAEDSELQSDHIGLLKNEQTPLSPDTVTTQWSGSSFSTASNTSG